MRSIFTALLLVGCAPESEYGPELTERALVRQTCYVPAGHGSGVGVGMKGDVSVHSVRIPARYAVVFECQHGQFAVNGQKTWEKVHQGETVTIRYCEVLEDGKAVDLHFIGVEK